MKDMLIQNLRSKALFSLNGIVYHPEEENVSERQEMALESIELITFTFLQFAS